MEWETNDIYGICWKNINRENFVSSEQKLFSHVNKPISIKEIQGKKHKNRKYKSIGYRFRFWCSNCVNGLFN